MTFGSGMGIGNSNFPTGNAKASYHTANSFIFCYKKNDNMETEHHTILLKKYIFGNFYTV